MDEQEDKMFDFGVALTRFCADYAKQNGLEFFERRTHLNGQELSISLKAASANHDAESVNTVSETPKVRKHNMSQENRLRAADRMKALWSNGKIKGRPRLTA